MIPTHHAILAAALLLAGCAGPTTFAPPPPGAPKPDESRWKIRREGEECGGYPAPGEALTKCAEGLVCDYDDAGVDMPGHCKRR
jgi:hypothetical protein